MARNTDQAGGPKSGATRPHFAIIGTGRCGTRYMAHVLQACGVHCGHEQWWTLRPANRREYGLDGDSSWMALPSIELGGHDGPVVHITRHPLGVVSSLVGIQFFGRANAFGQFSLGHEPDLADMSEVEAAAAWWTRWNDRCAAAADLTIRVEDAVGELDRIGKTLGYDLAGKAAQAQQIPDTVNHRRRWRADDLEAARTWRLLDGAGERYGYRNAG